MPLSCSMLILAPDYHSSYGSLVQKYFVAEGLASGHRVVLVDSDPKNFVRDLMWYQSNSTTAGSRGSSGDRSGRGGDSDAEAEQTTDGDQKIKIAWRYEQMKRFQTSVEPMSAYARLASGFEQGIAERMGHSFHTGLLTIIAIPSTCLCGFQTLLLKQHEKQVI